MQYTFIYSQNLIASGRQFADQIATTYKQRWKEWLLATADEQRELHDRLTQARAIDDGICIGSFLIEAGWLVQAATVLSMTFRLIVDQRQRHDEAEDNWEMIFTQLECLTR